MMIVAILLVKHHRYVIFEMTANWAMKLDWLTVVELDGPSKTRIERYGHKIPAWALHLRIFGETSTVKIINHNAPISRS